MFLHLRKNRTRTSSSIIYCCKWNMSNSKVWPGGISLFQMKNSKYSIEMMCSHLLWCNILWMDCQRVVWGSYRVDCDWWHGIRLWDHRRSGYRDLCTCDWCKTCLLDNLSSERIRDDSPWHLQAHLGDQADNDIWLCPGPLRRLCEDHMVMGNRSLVSWDWL